MSPVHTRTSRAVMATLSLGVLLAVGCSKKPIATPVPPPAPQETPAPTPTPPPAPPAPVETPPTAGVRTEDYSPAFFDYDAYSLRDDARTALDTNAKLLRANPKVTITIEGHCDERGTVEYNQALGEKRAQAARDYLVAAGIDGGRISIVTYGKERPFATGTDEASMQQNRRAHFVVRAAS
jgi:peptidoglycan-associated lipoprotein